MKNWNINSSDRSLLASPKVTSPKPKTPKTNELAVTVEEDKAKHVKEINAKYHKRLIKPLQINQRLRFQQELGLAEVSKQLQAQLLYTPSNEDAEKRYLIEKVRELTKISALHDKEIGNNKRQNLRLMKRENKKDFLQQHLDGALYNKIKDVNDRVERHGGQEGGDLSPEGRKQGLNDSGIHQKNAKDILQKQLQAMKEVKEHKLIPKQLNSNTFFRHSQRKLLYLRTMEADEMVIDAEEVAEEFFKKENEKEKLRRNLLKYGFRNYDSLVRKNPHERLNSSLSSPTHFKKMTRSAIGSNLHGDLSPQSFQNRRGSDKSFNLFGLPKDQKLVIESPDSLFNNSIMRSSMPLHRHRSSQPNGLPTLGDENTNPNNLSSVASMTRAVSQPNRFNITMFESVMSEKEKENALPQSNKFSQLDTQRSLETEEEHQKEERNQIKEEEEAERTEETQRDGKGQTFYKRLSGIKKIDQLYTPPHKKRGVMSPHHVEIMVPYESESKRAKESFRANLLSNIQKARVSRTEMVSENSHHDLSGHGRNRQEMMDGENMPVSRFRAMRLKSPDFASTRKKSKKKSCKMRVGEVQVSEMTVVDKANFLRALSEEKVPIKEEMQNILSRYGYKDIMLEVKKPKTKAAKLITDINRENIAKVEKFLERTQMKSTKSRKVD